MKTKDQGKAHVVISISYFKLSQSITFDKKILSLVPVVSKN